MNRDPNSTPEPLCDAGRPAGLLNLAAWSLALLLIWGLLVAGAWQLLSSHYQKQAAEANAAAILADNEQS